MARCAGQEALDVADHARLPLLAGALCRVPAGVQQVGRGHGEQAHVAPVLGDQADGRDRFGRHRPGVGHHRFRVRTGAPGPVRAGRDVRDLGRGEDALRLRDGPGG